MEHDHDFSPEEWPFNEPSDTTTFCQSSILDQDAPILTVFHDHDGDWQFLNSDIEPGEEPVIVCFGCIFDGDRSVGQLADLPPGHMAERDSVGEPWVIEEYESEDEDGED